MKHVTTAVTIDAPADRVWRLLSEFRHWPEWGPSITSVDASADRVDTGVTGRVRTVLGIWVPFRITTVCPGRSWDWVVAGIPATRHRVVPHSDGSCRVELTTPWATAPYLLVLRRALANLRRLAGSP